MAQSHPSTVTFQELLNLLSIESRSKKLELILVGGWALSFYGVSRQTLDVDFLTLEAHIDALDHLLTNAGYERVYRTNLFAKYRAEAGDLLDVDLLFVESKTMHLICTEGKTVQTGDAEFVVPSLFHLVAMKLHALKHNRERRQGRDMPDVLALLEANHVDVRAIAFKELCLRFGTSQLYDEIVAHNKS